MKKWGAQDLATLIDKGEMVKAKERVCAGDAAKVDSGGRCQSWFTGHVGGDCDGHGFDPFWRYVWCAMHLFPWSQSRSIREC